MKVRVIEDCRFSGINYPAGEHEVEEAVANAMLKEGIAEKPEDKKAKKSSPQNKAVSSAHENKDAGEE